MHLAHDITEAYRTLDLNPGATWAEVKGAYRRLARALHPDLNPGQGGEPMSQVNRAYQRLGRYLAAKPQPADGYRPFDFETWAPRQGQRPFHYEAFQSQPPRRSARPAAEPSQPFSPAPRPVSAPRPAPLAPVSPPPARPAPAPEPGPAPRAASSWRLVGLRHEGQDLVYQVRVSGRPGRLVLPLRGRRPCPQCAGGGRAKDGRGLCPACAGRGQLTSSQLLTVDLPAQWSPGQVLRLPGQGQEGGLMVELLSAAGEA